MQSRRSLNPHKVNMSSRRSLDMVRQAQLVGTAPASLHDSAEDIEAGSLKPAGKGQHPHGWTSDRAAAKKGFFGKFRRETDQGAVGGSRWGASYPLQVKVLFERSLKTRRFETLSTQDLIQYIIVGVLAGRLQSPFSILHGMSCFSMISSQYIIISFLASIYCAPLP